MSMQQYPQSAYTKGYMLSLMGGVFVFMDGIGRMFLYFIFYEDRYFYEGYAMGVIIIIIFSIIIFISANIMKNPNTVKRGAGASIVLLFSIFSIFLGLFDSFDIFLIFGGILGVVGGLLGFVEKPTPIGETDMWSPPPPPPA